MLELLDGVIVPETITPPTLVEGVVAVLAMVVAIVLAVEFVARTCLTNVPEAGCLAKAVCVLMLFPEDVPLYIIIPYCRVPVPVRALVFPD